MSKGIITEYFADSGLSPCILDLLFSIDLQLSVNLAQTSRCDLSGHGSRDSVMMGGIPDRKQY